MKYLITFFCVLVFMFAFCTPQASNKSKGEKQYWVEEICPECKGTGKVKASMATRVYLGIISFGPGAMIQTEDCGFCNGSGTIKKRILK